MEMGEKLRQARLAMGLSQRQLCQGIVTRNMLSLMESGSAQPSLETLKALSERLNKSISYFMDEDTVTSPNQQIMAQARTAFSQKEYALALELLEQYQQPDSSFDWEWGLLQASCAMELAEIAIAEEKLPHALHLLALAQQAQELTPYCEKELHRKRLLLLSQAQPGKAAQWAAQLPTDDRELLLRSMAALEEKDGLSAARYLDAAQQHTPFWHLQRGKACVLLGNYSQGADHFRQAEAYYPKICAEYLELCCRESEDYKGAYYYACKLRQLSGTPS